METDSSLTFFVKMKNEVEMRKTNVAEDEWKGDVVNKTHCIEGIHKNE